MASLASSVTLVTFSMEDSTSTNLSDAPSPKKAMKGWQLCLKSRRSHGFSSVYSFEQMDPRDDNTKKDLLLKQKERMRLGNNWRIQINYGGMLAIANDRMKTYQTEMQQSEASKQLLYLVFFLKRKKKSM